METKEPLKKSARADGERFCLNEKIEKRRNSLCISSFSICVAGAKDPPKTAGNLFRVSRIPYLYGGKEMAMIKCTECGKEISDSAERCPNCGCTTSHGTLAAEAKGLAIGYGIAMICFAVGLILFFYEWYVEIGPNLNVPIRYWPDDVNFSWTCVKVGMAAGLIVGSIIIQVKLRNRSKAAQKPERMSEADDVNVVFIPADKRQHGTCEMCMTEGIVADCKITYRFGTFKLCPKCIRKNGASIL